MVFVVSSKSMALMACIMVLDLHAPCRAYWGEP